MYLVFRLEMFVGTDVVKPTFEFLGEFKTKDSASEYAYGYSSASGLRTVVIEGLLFGG